MMKMLPIPAGVTFLLAVLILMAGSGRTALAANQGSLGTCAVHAYATIINDMLKLTVDTAIDEATLRSKIHAYADTDGVDLFAGSTSSVITKIINKRAASVKLEDADKRGVLHLSVLELPLDSHQELATVVSRHPGVASTYIAAVTGSGSHAVAGTRLHAGHVAGMAGATVMARNSHGAQRNWWSVTRKNFLRASLLMPIVWRREEMDVVTSKMKSVGSPEFTAEFEAVRDLYFPELGGGLRVFDKVYAARKVGSVPAKSMGVVAGEGRAEGTLSIEFFTRSGPRRKDVPLDAVRQVDEDGKVPSAPAPAAGAGAGAGKFRKGDDVIFFHHMQGLPCLTQGRVTKAGGKTPTVRFANGVGKYRPHESFLGLVDTYLPVLHDMQWKLGDKVISVATRKGWKSKDGRRLVDLSPGDRGTVTCYVPTSSPGELHVDVDFGHVEGSLPAASLVAGNLDEYDKVMGERLVGGFRRGQRVEIRGGANTGRTGSVEGPHPTLSEYLLVALHGNSQSVTLSTENVSNLRGKPVEL